MKSFKNMLVIVALFAIGSVSAKRTGAAVRTQPSAVTTQPAITTLTTKPFPTKGADTAMETELGKIDKNLTAIKNIASKVLNDMQITIEDRRQFLGRVGSTYSVITSACQEDFLSLGKEFDQAAEQKIDIIERVNL